MKQDVKRSFERKLHYYDLSQTCSKTTCVTCCILGLLFAVQLVYRLFSEFVVQKVHNRKKMSSLSYIRSDAAWCQIISNFNFLGNFSTHASNDSIEISKINVKT